MLNLEAVALSEQDVKRILNPKMAVEWVEKAYRTSAHPEKYQMPRKLYFTYPDGDMRVMPAVMEIDGEIVTGAKLVSVHFENTKKGLPVVIGSFALIDSSTGALLCIMDATYLTAMRTGASGAVAVKHLYKGKSAKIGVVGCGTQARTQILCIREVIKIEKVCAYDINPEAHRKFLEFCAELGIETEKENSLSPMSECDIVITLTPSRKPVVHPEHVEKTKLILAFGADGPGKQELDPEILKSSTVIVDDTNQAVHGGEINVPLSRGEVTRDIIFAELGQVIEGMRKPPDDRRVVFDSTGIALLDVAVGWAVWREAVKNKIGTKIKIH